MVDLPSGLFLGFQRAVNARLPEFLSKSNSTANP
jgi:hypothetical protein